MTSVNYTCILVFNDKTTYVYRNYNRIMLELRSMLSGDYAQFYVRLICASLIVWAVAQDSDPSSWIFVGELFNMHVVITGQRAVS